MTEDERERALRRQQEEVHHRAQVRRFAVNDVTSGRMSVVSVAALWGVTVATLQQWVDAAALKSQIQESIEQHLSSAPVLTSKNPEPKPGSLVRDEFGRVWECLEQDGFSWHIWVRIDGQDDPESWTKVAGNYGPVTLLSSPEEEAP